MISASEIPMMCFANARSELPCATTKHVYLKALLEQFGLPRMVMRVLRLILSFLRLVQHQMGCLHNDGRYVQSLDLLDLNLEEKYHKNDARYELVRHRIVLRFLF